MRAAFWPEHLVHLHEAAVSIPQREVFLSVQGHVTWSLLEAELRQKPHVPGVG